MEQNTANNQPKMPRFNMNWIYLLVIAALAFVYFSGEQGSLLQPQTQQRETSYTEFKHYLERGYVSQVVANKSTNTLRMYVKKDSATVLFPEMKVPVSTNPYMNVEFGSVDKLEQQVDSARARGQYDRSSAHGASIGRLFSLDKSIQDVSRRFRYSCYAGWQAAADKRSLPC